MYGLYGSKAVMWGRSSSIVVMGAAASSCSSAEGGSRILSPGNCVFREACVTVYCEDQLSSAGSGGGEDMVDSWTEAQEGVLMANDAKKHQRIKGSGTALVNG